MSSIQYDLDYLNLVKDLAPINSSVIFTKVDDTVVINNRDASKTIAYNLKADKKCFDFDGTELAFYNYIEFYSSLKSFSGKPNIEINNKNKITLIDGNSKLNVVLQDPESITVTGPKNINFKDPDIRFKLTAADLDDFIKKIGLIKPKMAQFTLSGNKIIVKIFNSVVDNTFEKSFDIENLTNTADEIDFVTSSEIFERLPSKRNYIINIMKIGFIKISLDDPAIGLDIFIGKVRS